MRQTFLNQNNKDYIPKEVEMINNLVKKGESFIDESKVKLEETQNILSQEISLLNVTKESLNNVLTSATTELTNLQNSKENILLHVENVLEEVKQIKQGEKGEPGKKGDTPNISYLKDEILSQIIIPKIPEELTGEQILGKINNLSLEEENKIDWERIKNAPKLESKIVGSPTVIANAVDLDSSTRQNNYAIVWDSSRSRYTHSSTGGSGTGTVETIVAGTGISVNSTDPANPIVSTTITQYTDEMAQDAVGTILVNSSEINFTYSDATPSITASLVAGSIDESKLDTSVNASLDLADTAVQPSGLTNYFNKTVDDTDDITEGTTKKFNVTHTGDVTGSTALTLATVNSNVGSFTYANITVNAKGLVTAASSNSLIGSSNTTSSSTPTPTGDSVKNDFQVTALATNATFSAPSGTPANNNSLIIRIKDNGTSRTLAWNAIYRFSTDLPAPTATTISKTMYLGFVYNSADSKWDNIAQINNI